MKIESEEFVKLFNLKKRLPCADCGRNQFRIFNTSIPNTSIEEAVMMTCNNCKHTRLELI